MITPAATGAAWDYILLKLIPFLGKISGSKTQFDQGRENWGKKKKKVQIKWGRGERDLKKN